MNRIGNKKIAADAAKLFEQEVRGTTPDVPREELCALVDEYVYYQTDDLSRQDAEQTVDGTCRQDRPRKSRRAHGRRARKRTGSAA